jgi:hypothetical protein
MWAPPFSWPTVSYCSFGSAAAAEDGDDAAAGSSGLGAGTGRRLGRLDRGPVSRLEGLGIDAFRQQRQLRSAGDLSCAKQVCLIGSATNAQVALTVLSASPSKAAHCPGALSLAQMSLICQLGSGTGSEAP